MPDDYEKLKLHLEAVAATAGAQFSALFVPSADGQALRLACSTQVDHGAIELAEAIWNGERPALLAGRAVRRDRAVLWPLMDDGRFAALVYLNEAPPGFPTQRDRATGLTIVERMRPRRGRPLTRAVSVVERWLFCWTRLLVACNGKRAQVASASSLA
jgi:hypothetical protein